MWSRRILAALLALVAGLLDVTVSGWLPGALAGIRFSLPLVTVLAAFSSLERAISAALVSGLVLDVLLPSSSAGLVTVRHGLIAIALWGLSQRLFTNRSLLGAQALGLFALLADRAMLAAVTAVGRAFSPGLLPEVRAAWWAEALWIAVCLGAVFLVVAAFTKRFLPQISRSDIRRADA